MKKLSIYISVMLGFLVLPFSAFAVTISPSSYTTGATHVSSFSCANDSDYVMFYNSSGTLVPSQGSAPCSTSPVGNPLDQYFGNYDLPADTYTVVEYNTSLLVGAPSSMTLEDMAADPGYVTSTTVTVEYQNQPPAVSSLSGGSITEGDTYTEDGSFTDSDSSSWTATVDYGDGSGVQSLTLSGMDFSLSHEYTAPGTYKVTVNVTDDDGAVGTTTAKVTVGPLAISISPTAFASDATDITSFSCANPNDEYEFFTSAGTLVPAQADGDSCSTSPTGSPLSQFFSGYSLPADTYTVVEFNTSLLVGSPSTNTLEDMEADPGYVTSTTVTVEYQNQPPAVSSLSGGSITEGDTYTEDGSFTDSDSSSWTATVDYGDGSGVQSLTLSGMDFSLSHEYTAPGTYKVTVNVTDDDGAVGTTTAKVTVGPLAISISPTAFASDATDITSFSCANPNDEYEFFTSAGTLVPAQADGDSCSTSPTGSPLSQFFSGYSLPADTYTVVEFNTSLLVGSPSTNTLEDMEADPGYVTSTTVNVE